MSKKATRLICILLAVLMVFGVAAYALSAGAFAVTQSEIDALQSSGTPSAASRRTCRNRSTP